MRVVCVCGGIGFPTGTASAKRVLLIGRGLVEAGVSYEVWHLGPSLVDANTSASGVAQGVAYTYLSPTVRRPSSRLARLLGQAYGLAVLPFKLAALPRRTIVHIYYQGCLWNAWALAWCRVLRLRSVQEACEWWPTTEYRTRLNTFLFHRMMFRWSSGALAISRDIEDKIHERARPGYPVLRIPVLSESARSASQVVDGARGGTADARSVIWCGELGGYAQDIRFMIDAIAALRSDAGRRVRLVLCGPKTPECELAYRNYAREVGLATERLEFPGFVSESELLQRCAAASAALMPLWLDSRSLTRFPTKTGLFASTATPIVTVGVGEIAQFLRDGHSATFYSAGDAVDCARRIEEILADPQRAARIGRTGRDEITAALDYRTQGRRVREWLQLLDTRHSVVPADGAVVRTSPVPAGKSEG